MDFDRLGFYRDVGLRAQYLRKRAGLKQGQVAADLGMPRASYGNVERGRQRVPVDVIWRLAVILNVPIQALLPEPRREKKITPADTLGLAGTAHAHILSDVVNE